MRQKLSKKKRFIYAGILASLISVSSYALMMPSGPAELWTIGKITLMSQNIIKSIATFGGTLELSIIAQFERLISAVAVATKQEALSAGVVSEGIRQSNAQLLNALKTQQYNSNLTDAVLNYGGLTGQGYNPCDLLARNQLLSSAFHSMPNKVTSRINSLDVGPGKMRDPIDAEYARITDHFDKFCSQAEADAGLCSLSEVPAGDSNASLLFQPVDEGSLHSDARKAFLQNILGSPNKAINPEDGSTVNGQAYFAAITRKDSLQSIPAYSLAWIDTANTRTQELGGKSPNEIFQERVDLYFGGEQAVEWSKTLARQTNRGLLVEANKIAGTRVWAAYQRYQQNQRIEANLAGLLILATEDYKDDLIGDALKASSASVVAGSK